MNKISKSTPVPDILLTRGEEYVVPRGATQLMENDIILILAGRKLLPKIHEIMKV